MLQMMRLPLPVPEPNLTPTEVIARAVALREELRAQQDEADERGTYSPAMHETFTAAGFYRITQPRMFGGYEFDLGTFYRVMLEIARGHPGVGWCLALGASHAFEVASHWSEQAQVELFGDGHFIAPHRAPPLGTLTPVDGGYRLSGQWDYCSGIPYATHFIGGALIRRPGQPPVHGHAVVAKGSYTILDDWGGDKVLGMRASGSNSVRVEDVFVPEHHVGYLAPGLASTPESMADGTPGTRLHGNPMYLGRLMGPYHATLVSVITGAAWAAIDEYERFIRSAKVYMQPDLLRADHQDSVRPLGLAMAKADAAEAVLLGAMHRYMELCARWARDRTPITIEDNFRLWAMVQQGGRLASDVVEKLLHAAGASQTKKGSRLWRYFCDVQMYRTHSSVGEEFPTYAARAHLGRPVGFRGL
jgi:alkylation response protein AidB-like acyl-CoA dehydrogenase